MSVHVANELLEDSAAARAYSSTTLNKAAHEGLETATLDARADIRAQLQVVLDTARARIAARNDARERAVAAQQRAVDARRTARAEYELFHKKIGN